MPGPLCSTDALIMLSLVEGFTRSHLVRLSNASRTPSLPGMRGDEGMSVLTKGLAMLDSGDSADKVLGVRDACARIGARILTLDSDAYPPMLRALPDAPLALYWKGVPWKGPDAVAIVGSRAPTGAGKEFARSLSEDLAGMGWTVVSGMARGIDAAAHEGAIKAGGTTCAVLGCGVDVVYPPEATSLRERILERGAIMSAYPPGTLPLPHRFPARNRIISGISRGVVVAEAPARSGALITARFALDQGREVMAVPGSPWYPHTAGSNRLLRDGATPVTSAQDVLDALGWAKEPEKTSIEGRVLGLLSGPRHLNDIIKALSVPPEAILPCLLEMELGKLLERLPGDYYKKLSKNPG